MIDRKQIQRAGLVSLWFMLLTFPLLAIKADPINKVIIWRFTNLFWIGLGSFCASLLAGLFSSRAGKETSFSRSCHAIREKLRSSRRLKLPVLITVGLFFLFFPFFFSAYQVSIMTTALIYVVLGLGLNIVVGFAGLLDLGYVAFFAVGAYSYALLNYHFGVGFWLALPIGASLGALFGILLGFPVLRLRGDYLAIVTLGFGEIIRLILENWNAFSFGPSGIANIPRPPLFGMTMDLQAATRYIYFLLLLLALFTIFVVSRLRDSRIGRAWLALREDEIACQAMGIDKTRTKLTAFALGATWAGMAGVVFAAKTTFINPASFTFLESAIILSIVVLGGMGSIVGVIIGAFVLILLPEYLRAFADYRMLLFGAIMVSMMVFRPQGILTGRRKSYLPSRPINGQAP